MNNYKATFTNIITKKNETRTYKAKNYADATKKALRTQKILRNVDFVELAEI